MLGTQAALRTGALGAFVGFVVAVLVVRPPDLTPSAEDTPPTVEVAAAVHG